MFNKIKNKSLKIKVKKVHGFWMLVAGFEKA